MAFKLNRFGWVEERGKGAADGAAAGAADTAFNSNIGLLSTSGIFMSPFQLQELVAGARKAGGESLTKESEQHQQQQGLQPGSQHLAAHARVVAKAAAATQRQLEEEEVLFGQAAVAAEEVRHLVSGDHVSGMHSVSGDAWQLLKEQHVGTTEVSGLNPLAVPRPENAAQGTMGGEHPWPRGGGGLADDRESKGQGLIISGWGRSEGAASAGGGLRSGQGAAGSRGSSSSRPSTAGEIREEHLGQVQARLDYLLAQLQPQLPARMEQRQQEQQQQGQQKKGVEESQEEQQPLHVHSMRGVDIAAAAARGQKVAREQRARALEGAGSPGRAPADDMVGAEASAAAAAAHSNHLAEALGVSSIGSWLAASPVTSSTNSPSSSRSNSISGDQGHLGLGGGNLAIAPLDATSQHMQELRDMADALQAALGEYNAAAVAAAAAEVTADGAAADRSLEVGDMSGFASGVGGREFTESTALGKVGAGTGQVGRRVGVASSSSSMVGSSSGEGNVAVGGGLGGGFEGWREVELDGQQDVGEESAGRGGGARGRVWGEEASGEGLTDEFISASSASEP
jgi:hypothetical protein